MAKNFDPWDYGQIMDRIARDMFIRSDANAYIGVASPGPANREEELESALRDAKSQIQKLSEFIENLKKEPCAIGTVISRTEDGRGLVSVRGASIEVTLPVGAEPGSQLRMLLSTNQPVSALKSPADFGSVVTVDLVQNGEVHYSSGVDSKTATIAGGIKAPESGDRVQLDPSGRVALRNLGRDSNRFAPGSQSVLWTDIGGLEEAKEALREAIEYPRKYAEVYAAYGQAPSKGVLLYGPPGGGKTMLGKATATAMGDPAGFLYVKGAEVLSKWVGESESTVRSIFDRARDFKRRTGNDAVVFIDEAEALLGVRGGSGFAVNSMTVPSFLAEMDGLEDSGAFVILSTNRPDSLDPAIVRDGRIDRRIRVGRPDRAASEQILRISLRNRPCRDLESLCEAALSRMYSAKLATYELVFADGAIDHVRLSDMLSGAVIAGFVKRAGSIAIRRTREGKAGADDRCITGDDMTRAISESFREMSDVHNIGTIIEKAETIGKIPVNIKKAVFYAGSDEAHFGPAVEFGQHHVQAAGGGALN